jgi:hypothetical protein
MGDLMGRGRRGPRHPREDSVDTPPVWPWVSGTMWLGGRRWPARRRRSSGDAYTYELELDGVWGGISAPETIKTWIGQVTH